MGAQLMRRSATFDPDRIRAAYEVAPGRTNRAKLRHVAGEMGCSMPTVARALKGDVRHSRSPGGPAKLGGLSAARVLPIGHPATMDRHTIFPHSVVPVRDEWVLKSGTHSAKLGAKITKGAWRGFPIYSLTLEERATCPTSCRHWGSCYGNNMHMARRWRHGPELEWRIVREIAALELRHPGGFAVRLHSLGDFYSAAYVDMWDSLLSRHAGLRVFGFTARIDVDRDPVARAVAVLVRARWPQFAIRFSNAPVDRCSTVSIESPVQKPEGGFICPAQWTPSGKRTECCATCALCWSTTKPVAFLQH